MGRNIYNKINKHWSKFEKRNTAILERARRDWVRVREREYRAWRNGNGNGVNEYVLRCASHNRTIAQSHNRTHRNRTCRLTGHGRCLRRANLRPKKKLPDRTRLLHLFFRSSGVSSALAGTRQFSTRALPLPPGPSSSSSPSPSVRCAHLLRRSVALAPPRPSSPHPTPLHPTSPHLTPPHPISPPPHLISTSRRLSSTSPPSLRHAEYSNPGNHMMVGLNLQLSVAIRLAVSTNQSARFRAPFVCFCRSIYLNLVI